MKNILFICPRFFNYDVEIMKCLQANHNVEFWDERPSNSVVFKILLRLKVDFLISGFIQRYYAKLFKSIEGTHFDSVFIVNPEAGNKSLIQRLRNICIGNNPECKFSLYLWDSIKNKPRAPELFDLFDRVATFDDNDAKKLGLTFIPLFYIPAFDALNKKESSVVYDLCFIGTAHSHRMSLFHRIVSSLSKARKLSCFSYFYFHGRIVFMIKKMFHLSVPACDIQFVSLSSQQVSEFMCSSNIIIDINHPGQSGLTMRTIECIGLNKKIITTNKNVKGYDFYDPRYIFVYDDTNTSIPDDFLLRESVNYRNREAYSLSAWVSKNIDSEVMEGL